MISALVLKSGLRASGTAPMVRLAFIVLTLLSLGWLNDSVVAQTQNELTKLITKTDCLGGDAVRRRRDFINLIAESAVSWPRSARAHQKSIPAIGLLGGGAPT
jgi:hypothetical protein